MKLLKLTGRGIGPAFRSSEFTLDLGAIPGKLIACVGQNGAGKSTLLGCWPAALFRDIPTRGSLVDLAKAAGCKDAYVEAHVETPTPYRIRISTNGESSEAFVTNGDGHPVLASTSVRSFDAWAAQHLPPRAVFDSTMFTAQGSSGWVGMSAAERKAVILRTLGIERLELLAEKAREHGRETQYEISRLTQVLEHERRTATTVARAEEDLANARSNAGAAAVGVESARTAHDEACARHEALVAAYRDAVAAGKRHEEARRARDEANRRADELSRRAAMQRNALREADAVRAAVADLPAREESVRQAVTVEREAVEAARVLQSDLDAAIRAHGEATRRQQAATKRVNDAQSAAADLERARVEAAKADDTRALLREATNALTAAGDEVVSLDAEIEKLFNSTMDVAGNRIAGLRNAHEQIAAAAPNAVGIATLALGDDDQRALTASEAPARIEERKTIRLKLTAAVREADRGAANLQAALREMERAADRIPDLERAAAARADAVTEADAAGREAADAAQEISRANVKIAAQRITGSTSTELRRIAEQAANQVRLRAAGAPAIAAAEAALAEIESQLPAAAAAVRTAEAALAHAPAPPADVPLPPDLATQERALADAETLAEERRAAVAVAEGALVTAVATAARIEQLDADRRALDEDLADWTKLGEDLGQRGLIAMEVDAAGPELSTIATQLVHDCFGTRWTLTIETTRAKADGSGSVEVCDVRVLDTVDGTEVPIEKKSGGQLVILSQAVRLALMTVACRRSGVNGATLVLDESGAALDEESRPAFVAMLRKAAALVNADKVLICTHDREVAGMCDARVRVAAGAVTVELN